MNILNATISETLERLVGSDALRASLEAVVGAGSNRVVEHIASATLAATGIAIYNYFDRRRPRSLNLSFQGLAVLPEEARNPKLNWIDLSFNFLTDFPDVVRNSELQILHLTSNRLEVCPRVAHNPALRILHLGYNRISRSSDVIDNPNLTMLRLDNNRLEVCPNVTQCPRLSVLQLSYNQLTALSDSILSLPRDCVVNAQHNRFTLEYVQNFMQRLEQHRIEHPGQGPHVLLSVADENPAAPMLPLDQQLASWSAEIAAASSGAPQERFASLLSLDQDNQELLSHYLGRLRETRDYRNGGLSKTNVIQRAGRMLELANGNEEFRLKLLALLNEGLESCGDRVLIVFNEIEILWQFYHRELSREEFRDLAICAQRYERLKKHAREQAEARGLGDEIETILHFQLKLKKALNLPITTRNMLYAEISGVTPEMLAEAKEKIGAISDEELLRDSSYWQETMQKLYPNEYERVKNRYGQLLEEAETYFGKKGQERADFLRQHRNLKKLLDQGAIQGACDYSAIALFIDRQRKLEVAKLGDRRPVASAIDRKRKQEPQAESHKKRRVGQRLQVPELLAGCTTGFSGLRQRVSP